MASNDRQTTPMRKRTIKPAPQQSSNFTTRELQRVIKKVIAKVRPKKVREMSDFERKLVNLLDLIEVSGDSTLARQRFALAEEQGYTVVITGERVSGALH